MLTRTEIKKLAQQRITRFMRELDRDESPSPPHRLQHGRPAPDLERDLAAEASRVWHEPVERVEASRDRVREAERKAETPQPLPQKQRMGRPRGTGLCSHCRVLPKVEGRAYCPGCAVAKSIENRDERRERKRIGLPPRKPGRPRKAVLKPARSVAA